MNKSGKVAPSSLINKTDSSFDEIKERRQPTSQAPPEEIEQERIMQFLRQKENLQRQEQLIYDGHQKEIEKEIVSVCQDVKELVVRSDAFRTDEDVDRAISQPVITPSKYELGHWQHLKSLIKNKINDSSSWLIEFNNRKRKRGDFWGVVADKKHGGSQYLLSSEHYASRSAA